MCDLIPGFHPILLSLTFVIIFFIGSLIYLHGLVLFMFMASIGIRNLSSVHPEMHWRSRSPAVSWYSYPKRLIVWLVQPNFVWTLMIVAFGHGAIYSWS